MASVTDLILGGLKTVAGNAAKNAASNSQSTATNNKQSAATPASSVSNTQSASVPTINAQNTVTSTPSSYTPLGTHNDATVRQQSAQDTAQLQSLSNQWHAATAAGDTAAAAEYHRQAEAIRAGYGYSGGQDGSDYLGHSNAAPHVTHGIASPTLPAPNSYEQAIRDMNAAYQQQQLAGLRNAYDNSVVNLDRAEAQIAPTFQNARNQTAATNAQNTRAMNEAFAARGLNTGASGQAALAQNSVLQRDMTTLNESEAEAISEIQLQRRTLENEYQFAIENARATGNYQLAQNLLSEWQRYDNALMSQAMNQFGIDLQAANFNYGVYSDQQAFDEGVRQYDQNYAANRSDTAYNQNFQQSQADRDYQQWLAQMGANVGDFSGLQGMGVNPTDQYLAAYNQSLLPSVSSSGGGGGGGGSTTDGALSAMLQLGSQQAAWDYLMSLRGMTDAMRNKTWEMFLELDETPQGGAVPGTPMQNNSGGFLSGIGNAISGAGNAASNVVAELGLRQELAGMSTTEARAERVAQAVNSGLITTEQGHKILAPYVG
jgi:hypothetical protein